MRRVVELRREAHVADHHLSLLDADPRPAQREAARQLLAAMALGPARDGERAGDRLVGMISQVQRRIEHRMHRVADELVDHAAMRDDDPRHAFEVAVQQADQLLGARACRKRRKALDVREQGGDPSTFAVELEALRRGDDPRHDAGSEMLLESATQRRLPPPGQRISGERGRQEAGGRGEERRRRIQQRRRSSDQKRERK